MAAMVAVARRGGDEGQSLDAHMVGDAMLGCELMDHQSLLLDVFQLFIKIVIINVRHVRVIPGLAMTTHR